MAVDKDHEYSYLEQGARADHVGEVCTYVDPSGIEHQALVTAVWGEYGTHAINIVYVPADASKTDQYGRQIQRETSVQAEGPTAAHGRYYKVIAQAE